MFKDSLHAVFGEVPTIRNIFPLKFHIFHVSLFWNESHTLVYNNINQRFEPSISCYANSINIWMTDFIKWLVYLFIYSLIELILLILFVLVTVATSPGSGIMIVNNTKKVLSFINFYFIKGKKISNLWLYEQKNTRYYRSWIIVWRN